MIQWKNSKHANQWNNTLKTYCSDFLKTPVEDISKMPLKNERADQTQTAASGVIIDGIDSCLVKFSKCCNPLPGDDIIGFITRGYGVSIHKRSCTNVPVNISEISEYLFSTAVKYSSLISTPYTF